MPQSFEMTKENIFTFVYKYLLLANARLTLLTVALAGLSTACSTTINRQMEQSSITPFDSLRTVYYDLSDSLDWAFETMMQDDNHKIAHMQRILDEIRKTKEFSPDTLDSLDMLVKKLQSVRYDSVSLASNEVVSRYDSLARYTSEAVVRYAENYPGFEDNPVMHVLVDQIVDANNSIFLYRLQYDRLTQEFNQFLEEYRSLIATLDSTGRPVQKRPAFKLVNDYKEKKE